MLRSIQTITAKKLFRMYQNDELDFSLVVQRGLVWDIKRKSLFIDSLINDYPVPMLFSVKINGVLHFLDGQQRLYTVFDFISNNLKLHKVNAERLHEECYFDDLPQDIKEDIEGYSFSVCEITPKNDRELEQTFIRLNNGMALTTFELSRAKAGKQVMTFVSNLAKKPFFENLPYSKSQLRKHVNEEDILLAMGLMSKRIKSTASVTLRTYMELIREKGFANEEAIELVIEYLGELDLDPVLAYRQYIKRHNLALIMLVAYKTNLQMPHDQFAAKLTEFFSNPPAVFRLASNTNAASATQYKIEALCNHFGIERW